MAYQATVYSVMIASPSDVADERKVAREVIYEWNAVHSRERAVVLMPVGWESHSSPRMGTRPQEVINQQVLKDADLLVAVFWTRIGSPTGQSPSGTVEEINEHLAARKPAMIYFSSVPVRPDSVEEEQYTALCHFRDQCRQRGLIEEYGAIPEFREKFARQLQQTIIRDLPSSDSLEALSDAGSAEHDQLSRLSDDARQLLAEAALDKSGDVVRSRSSKGLVIETNKRNFVQGRNPRSEARWEAALKELCVGGLLEEVGLDSEIFSVTNLGYRLADRLG